MTYRLKDIILSPTPLATITTQEAFVQPPQLSAPKQQAAYDLFDAFMSYRRAIWQLLGTTPHDERWKALSNRDTKAQDIAIQLSNLKHGVALSIDSLQVRGLQGELKNVQRWLREQTHESYADTAPDFISLHERFREALGDAKSAGLFNPIARQSLIS